MNGPRPPSGSAWAITRRPIAFTRPLHQRPAAKSVSSAGAMLATSPGPSSPRGRACSPNSKACGRRRPYPGFGSRRGRSARRRRRRARRAHPGASPARQRRLSRGPPRAGPVRRRRASAPPGSGAPQEQRAGRARVRTSGDPELGVERLRQRLHRPRFEVDVAAAHESARAGGKRRRIVLDSTPGERAEEADRVVLAAIALPVAGDDLLAPARPARLGRRPLGHLGTAFASAAGFCQVTASWKRGSRRDPAQPLRLVARARTRRAPRRESRRCGRQSRATASNPQRAAPDHPHR